MSLTYVSRFTYNFLITTFLKYSWHRDQANLPEYLSKIIAPNSIQSFWNSYTNLFFVTVQVSLKYSLPVEFPANE